MRPAMKLAVWISAWPLLAAIASLQARDEPVPDWCADLLAAAKPVLPVTRCDRPFRRGSQPSRRASAEKTA